MAHRRRPYCSGDRRISSPLPAKRWSIHIGHLHAAQALGVDPDWKLWPPSYGWWLELRQRTGIAD